MFIIKINDSLYKRNYDFNFITSCENNFLIFYDEIKKIRFKEIYLIKDSHILFKIYPNFDFRIDNYINTILYNYSHNYRTTKYNNKKITIIIKNTYNNIKENEYII